MGVGKRGAGLAERIGEKPQSPRGGNRRLLLAKRSGSGIARIGEYLGAGRFLRRVQRQEIRLVHIELAAHLNHPWRRSSKGLRHRIHHADIGRHILALGPVAARRRLFQPATLIAQRQRQPVNLRLGGKGKLVMLAQRQEPADAGGEILDILVGEAVVQRQHRTRMAHLAETGGSRRADAQARAVYANQCREGGFERAVAGHQRVIVGIADDRIILAVIARVVKSDGGGQTGKLGLGGCFVHLFRRQCARPDGAGNTCTAIVLLMRHSNPPAGPGRRRVPLR